jgi:glutamine synthetase
LVRTVVGRIEWRLPDPSCNVYAAIAATLAAGLDGMDRAMAPPPPCAEDLYERRTRGDAMPGRLPENLNEALTALQGDTLLCQAVGDRFCAQFIQLKRAEWDAFNSQVSDWELRNYADAF